MKKTFKERFWEILEDIFIGADIEGEGGYVNLLKVKRKYFRNFLRKELELFILEKLNKYNAGSERKEKLEEEIYTKLYTFFHRYFSEIGSIYFNYTPLFYKIYEKVYKDNDREGFFKPSEENYNTDYEQIYTERKDTALFWKTKMLYYIKTDRIIQSLEVYIPEINLIFFFDTKEIEYKKNNEKKEFIYEFIDFDEKGRVILKVYYSEKGKKVQISEISKKIKEKFKNVEEKHIIKAIKTFEKQSFADYFINKDSEGFLKEQFNLWMYQYLYSSELDFDPERIRQLKILKEIAYKIIEFIAQFEEELKRIWEKPRFVFNSNYVITIDRLYKKDINLIKELIEKLKVQEKKFRENLSILKETKRKFKHIRGRYENYNISNQFEEWYLLDIIDENFHSEEILKGDFLNEKYRFLPIDTKFFRGLKEKIEKLFNLDEELDGWLIKSENWQALNTILPRFKGKVQTIYIDPPFNKAQDADYDYIVKFKDSTWITMLENRISLAKEFLNERGSIFVRCDYNGNMYVRLLLNDIFGEENFRNELIVSRTKKIFTGVKGFNVANDYVLFFSKTENFLFKEIYKERKKQKWVNMHSPGERKPPERIILGKVYYPPKGRHWTFVQEKINELEKQGRIRINKDIEYVDMLGNKVKGMPQYLTSDQELLDSNWTDIQGYSFNWGFSTENSEILLKRVIESTSDEGDLIMDFFLGSGTTIAVAHKLKRRWIGIEMGEHFWSVVLPRMKKVLYYDKSGISKEKDVKEKYNPQNAGGFFKYYELEQYEDILRTIEYTDTDIKEFTEALKEILQEEYNFARVNPFIFDKKLTRAIKIHGKEIKLDLKALYPDKDIDLKESISNIKGIPLNQVKPEELEIKDFKELLEI